MAKDKLPPIKDAGVFHSGTGVEVFYDQSENKSILDGTPVENKASAAGYSDSLNRIPPHGRNQLEPFSMADIGSSTGRWREVVGNCPRCGAPLYGTKNTTSDTPEVVYSCTCRLSVGTFADTIQTK